MLTFRKTSASTSACALTTVVGRCAHGVPGEDGDAIGPGWVGHSHTFKPRSDNCSSRHPLVWPIPLPVKTLVCSTNRTPTERVKSFTLQACGCQSEVRQNQGRMVMWVDKMKFSLASREMRKMKTIHEASPPRFQGRSLCQFRVPAGNRQNTCVMILQGGFYEGANDKGVGGV